MKRWLLVLLALAGPAAAAQAPLRPDAVYVATMGQGDQIWERFGHNFLVVPDTVPGRHVAYNWGVFDFAAPDFLSRFLVGDTRYWMEAQDFDFVLRIYRHYNRSITLQRLALAPAQVDSLRAALAWNALPENRYYRYDYFLDNCSTRLRDALDRATGGALRRSTSNRLTNLTFRNESIRLTDEAPFSQVGINVALGQPADAQLSAWEAMFIPMRLQEYLREVSVGGPQGTAVPLVAEEQVLFRAAREPELTRAPGMLWEHAVLGLLLAGLLVLAGWLAARGNGGGRVALAVLGGGWGLVAGVIGIVLLLAWTATRHAFWYRNENLLQFNPLAVALLVLVPLAVRRPRWWGAARFVAYGVAVISLLGAALKFMPWMMQDNWAVIVLALPVNVALAWAVTAVSRAAFRPGPGELFRQARPGERRRARALPR